MTRRAPRLQFVSGATLIETLVVITVSSAVMGIVVTILNSAYTNDRIARQSMQISLSHFQLAQRFRSDAHRAVHIEPIVEPSSGKAVGLRFEFPNGKSSEYRSQGRSIQNIHLDNGRAVLMDSYRVPKEVTVSWEIRPNDALERRPQHEKPQLAAMLMTTVPDPNASSLNVPPIMVEAVVGLLELAPGGTP